MSDKQQGTAMIVVLVFAVVVIGASLAALSSSTAESRHSELMARALRARYVAEAGNEQAIALLKDGMHKASLADPFGWLDALNGQTVYTDQPLAQDGYLAGSFTVSLAVSSGAPGDGGGPVVTPPQTDGSGFTSTISATDNGDGTTTISVTLSSSGAPGSKALSHVTFGLPASAQGLASSTAASPGNYPTEWAAPDPTTGVTGLKYDGQTLGENQVAESQTYTWQVPTGEVASIVVATKAGPQVATVQHELAGGAGGGAEQLVLDRLVTITSVAWSPAPGARGAVRAQVTSTVRVALERARIFDYAYFLHNWGWFYGNSIVANGNVRANGQFDGGNYSSTINGEPRYATADGPNLAGYVDSGGIYSGWDIVQSGQIQGMGGQTENQRAFIDPLSMPNLTDLSLYESLAKSKAATISIGGQTIVSGVWGDDAGETQQLYLEGTASNPIVITGPVVVRGSVIIKGVVTGQGAIYAGGNVYIPNNLTYANPPATWRPASTSLADRVAWRTANQSKDALGLFAREHIVLGDFTNGSANYYMSSWLASPMNVSAEDTGQDQIASTQDTGEADGQWTVEQYSAADQALGLIPAGKQPGDAVPGSGEDTDGDGLQDGTSTTAQFALPAALDSGQWGGNLPPGTTQFNQIATIYVSQFDAALYTNHVLGGLLINWGGEVQFNGAVVSRNESLIYGANQLTLNHDDRLTAGGEAFGFYLPYVWAPIKTLSYEVK